MAGRALVERSCAEIEAEIEAAAASGVQRPILGCRGERATRRAPMR